ncbi:MAG: TadE/TadG family type IV pilus assembly protein [Gemmatimonadota bacterium]
MRRRRHDAGQSVLELAIAMPVLLALLVGIFEFGIAWNRKQVLTNAAREGARMGVLDLAQNADVDLTVDTYLTSAGINPADVTKVYAGIGAPTGQTVTITLSLNHQLAFVGPIVGLLGGSIPGVVTLASTVNMRHE